MLNPIFAGPVSSDEFFTAMQVAKPFEKGPHLTIAVSGGADSMALAMLGHRWAKAQNGKVTALIVDHDLREESSHEARISSERLSEFGIPSVILKWSGTKPTSGIQAKARAARYELMNAWCCDNNVLHLLVGHHANDQAETFMMRVQHGSGPDGLAAMAPVRMLSACQIIRPLLAFPKERLIATLMNSGMRWIEDPSNNDPKFDRVKVRGELKENAIDVLGVARGAERFRRVRQALDLQVSDWLARYADLRPEGYLCLHKEYLYKANAEIRLRILSKAAMVCGGNVYPPSIAAIERLDESIRKDKGATLGGARFVVDRQRIIACREARNLPSEVMLSKRLFHWDQRFLIASVNTDQTDFVMPWSPEIAKEVSRSERPTWFENIPDHVRQSFPVIKSDKGYRLIRPGCTENKEIFVQFSPKIPLSGEGFSVA